MLFVIFESNAQVPQKMSYQAVIRNQNNSLLSNILIAMKISIIQTDSLLEPVYQEYQLATTNINGLVSLQIGTGIVMNGDFKKIDWSKGPYFIKTETDPEGGFNFRIVGTSELLSVPFALYALNNSAGFDSTSMHTSIVNLQKQALDNKNDIKTNLDSIQQNAKQIEINLNNITANTYNIKNNLDTLNGKINSVDLDALLLNYQKVGKFVTAISLEGQDSFDIKIKGNLIASNNVTIGGNIESLGATSTLGTIDKPFKGLFISSGSLSIASDTLGKEIPAAILSNVEGNLQISAGGLKLMGDNTSFIAPRIVSTLTGNASTATKLSTARKINGVAFDGSSDITLASIDTTSLSNRIILKLGIVDTSNMLSLRLSRDTAHLSERINLKLNIADTNAMLSARFKKDTSYLSNRINLKLNTSGNQILNGNLTLNDLYINGTMTAANDIEVNGGITSGYSVIAPSITFPNHSVQTSASHILTSISETGGVDPKEPIKLDLNKSLLILTGNYFFLGNGVAGQIIYFVPSIKRELVNPADIHIYLTSTRALDLREDATSISASTAEVDVRDWQPFSPNSTIPSIAVAIWIGDNWSLSTGVIKDCDITIREKILSSITSVM